MAVTKICLNRGCKKPETSKRGGVVCQCEKPLWRYQVSVTDPKSGKRIRYTYKTKKEAVAQEAKLVSLKAEKRDFLEVKPGYTTTFNELVEKYESFKRDDVKRFDDNIKKPLGRAKDHFNDLLLAAISSYELSEFMAKFKKDFEQEYNRKPSRSTINKQVHVLSNLFTMSVEWGMLDKSPFEQMKNGRKRTLRVKEQNREVFLTPEEANKLLEEAPDHLREIIIVALNTGMRRGEILGLRWDRISRSWIYLKETKTDDQRQVPINEDVARVLKVIKARQMKEGTFEKSGRVFLFDGKPLSSIKTAWYATCRRAGIKCRFHDLRHTFASWYLKKRKNIPALQKLLGHKEITMTMRYAHFIEDDLLEEVEAMSGMVNANLLPTHC
ncbi:MAG: site-specific integrase [Deltaproteobacteria bacterium]|nr:MAG: site-specific integrase [Deltaproteobacteria bacterium]